jgi:hypothetical protein
MVTRWCDRVVQVSVNEIIAKKWGRQLGVINLQTTFIAGTIAET